MNFRFYRSLCVLILLATATAGTAQTTRLVSKSGSNTGNCATNACASINYAISQAMAGDIILINDGVYEENVTINKSLTLKSVNGAANTILSGVNSGAALGTVHLLTGSNNVTIGISGHGFTVLGLDGTAGLEKAAIYLQGAQSNISIEGNEIVARGDAALMTEFSGIVNGININNNTFSGSTFIGAPAGDGFAAQFTLPNIPRQVVVIGGGAGTVNTQNITFTNNTISAISGGISTTDNAGATVAAHEQGNTLVTIDAAGTNIITGNNFSGTTTNTAEALRARGAGVYTITGNSFFGSYPRIFTAATNPITVGEARALDVFNTNSMNGTLDGHIIFNNCTPINANIDDVYAVEGQAPNTIYLGYGPQSLTLTGTVSGSGSYTYSWSSNRGDSYLNTASITVSPVQTTSYTFTATEPSGCEGSATKTINVIDIRDGNSKIFICCNGKTNSVAVSAVPAHLAHGDQLGICQNSMRKTDHIKKGTTVIYPNPTSGSFSVETTAGAKIIVYDQQGRVVDQQLTTEGISIVNFNLSDLSKGIYFVEIQSENGVEREKLIVQ